MKSADYYCSNPVHRQNDRITLTDRQHRPNNLLGGGNSDSCDSKYQQSHYFVYHHQCQSGYRLLLDRYIGKLGLHCDGLVE